jgi:hypothetical protein
MNMSISTLLFATLNSTTIVSLGIWLFIKKFLPIIKADQKQKIHTLMTMQTTMTELYKHIETANAETIANQQEADRLLMCMERWHLVMNDTHRNAVVKQNKQLLRYQQRMKDISNTRVLQRLYSNAQQKAITKARENLTHIFQSKEKQETYVKKIGTLIKESI